MKKFIINLNRKFDKLEETKRFLVFMCLVGTTLGISLYFLHKENSNPLFIVIWILIFGIFRLYYLTAEKNSESSETDVPEPKRIEIEPPVFSMSMGSMHDHNEDSVTEHAKRMIDEIGLVISDNLDEREKVIGDRVMIWDGSGNKDKRTGEKRWGIDELFKNNKAIVIETECDVYADNHPHEQIHIRAGVSGQIRYHLDLLVAYPSGEEIYVASKFVKIVD